MKLNRTFNRMAAPVVLALGLGAASTEAGRHKGDGQRLPAKASASAGKKLDRSAARQIGKASYYAHKFAGRKMADGTRMNPHADHAASKTLPLGTVARVTNLETGRSATVTIRDRGPYVAGRIIDLSPSTAEKIGITRENGVALVAVAPIALPAPGESPRRSLRS